MLREIIRHYTREAGVRNLERKIATVCRKAARQMVEGKTKTLRLTAKCESSSWGRRASWMNRNDAQALIGVAMGLAYTEYGGEILPVEVAAMPGRGGLTVTGRLGEVMQESAKAALSYARSRSKELGIRHETLDKPTCISTCRKAQSPKMGRAPVLRWQPL